MDDPVLLRENTIGITYKAGEIKDDHYENIIEKILGVSETDVVGIDDRGATRFLFEVRDNETYDRICEQFTGKDISIDQFNVIQVDDISSYGTRIEISRVPFAIDNNMLKIILQKYGEIYKCQNYYRKFGKYNELDKTGDRIVWMKPFSHIPQQLEFKNSENIYINVKYENQPMSCNKCGSEGHRQRYCNVRPCDFKNVIDLEEIVKEISKKQIANDNDSSDYDGEEMEEEGGNDDKNENGDKDELDVSLNNLDIHIEPSQKSVQYECKECEYTCKYEHLFKEHLGVHKGENSLFCSKCDNQFKSGEELRKHMQTHMDEKLYNCEICEFDSKDRHAYEKHILEHENEKLLECSKCIYKCQNKDVLHTHLKTHDIYACNKCEYVGDTMQGLNGHLKIHNKKEIRCTKCEYICTTINKLNTHMRIHTDEEIQVERMVKMVKGLTSTNGTKRDLSVSPEVEHIDKRDGKKNLASKKKKTIQ